MLGATEHGSWVIDLYRGELLARASSLRRQGVRPDRTDAAGGFPDILPIALARIPASMMQYEADPHVLAHVVRRPPSPFVSFTTDRSSAVRYALANGRRNDGLLVSTRVQLVRRHVWEVPLVGDSVVYEDTVGRRWIDLADYNSASLEALIGSAGWRTFRHNARRDREWLLFGPLAPREIAVEKVAMPWWRRVLAA